MQLYVKIAVGVVLGILMDIYFKKFGEMMLQYKKKAYKKSLEDENKAVIFATYVSIPLAVAAGFVRFNIIGAILSAIIVYLGAITVYVDEYYRVIPNELMLAMFAVETVLILTNLKDLSILSSLGSLALVTAVFAVTVLVGNKLFHLPLEGIGAGDLKFMMVVGYYAELNNLSYFLFGFVVSLIIRIGILFVKRKYIAKLYFPMAFHIFAGLIVVCILSPFGGDLLVQYISGV